MAYLVLNCILQKLEKVPEAFMWGDRLLVVSFILDNLEKGSMTRSLVPLFGGRKTLH